jgi:hypothetical protein
MLIGFAGLGFAFRRFAAQGVVSPELTNIEQERSPASAALLFPTSRHVAEHHRRAAGC